MTAPARPTPAAGDSRYARRGFTILFFTELWERFSFYGMRGVLVLYLVAAVAEGGGGMSEATAVALYSAYNSSIYLTSLPGGWLADRVLGARRAVAVGGVLIACGHFSMAMTAMPFVFTGLALIALGTGLLKPSISTLVGQLYPVGAARRDSGFTLFYMAINLGGFSAPLVVGTVAENVDWHLGFLLSGLGMTIAVVIFLAGGRHLREVGAVADPLSAAQRRDVIRKATFWLAIAVGVVLVDVLAGSFDLEHVIYALSLLALVLPVWYFAKMRRDTTLDGADLARVSLLVVFFAAAVVFQMVADQAGSLLSLFADESTDRSLFGWEFPASWFQSVNPVYIILFAPVLALLWRRLGRRQPTVAVKFALALLLVGLSFGAMGLAGMAVAASPTGTVGIGWLLAVLWLQTLGELLLAPTGLSLFSGLAPRRYATQVVGLWFMAVAAGSALNSWLTRLNDPLGDTLYFGLEGAVAVTAGLILFSVHKRVTAKMSALE